MRSSNFPFAVMPQGYAVRRFDKGGPAFAVKKKKKPRVSKRKALPQSSPNSSM
jgi:hypothetical protein